jgi:hypothetical protein
MTRCSIQRKCAATGPDKWLEFARGYKEPADHLASTGAFTMEHLMVSPISDEGDLVWIDPAGYAVARSTRPLEWPVRPGTYDVDPNVTESSVSATPYLPYRGSVT